MKSVGAQALLAAEQCKITRPADARSVGANNGHVAKPQASSSRCAPRPPDARLAPERQKLNILRYWSIRSSMSARSIDFMRSRLKSSTLKLATRMP
jgi:hypothetical protein